MANDFLQGIITQITRATSFIFGFFNPLFLALSLLGGVFAAVAGAFANPRGWVNSSINFVIDYISEIFPQTPPNLKIASLIASAPFVDVVGTRVISETLVTIASMASIALMVKIYKLIPFKAT